MSVYIGRDPKEPDFLEIGGKRYRLVEEEQESPWPFEPSGGAYPIIDVIARGARSLTYSASGGMYFPDWETAHATREHLLRVLRSLRLYENAKATGALDSLWHVTGVVEQGRGIWAPEMMFILAQAGRLFATEAEARAFAEGQE